MGPIMQGAVFWVRPGKSEEDAEVRIPHPHVVVQYAARNEDPRAATVTLCAITTNARKIAVPGNVLLSAGEASLPRQSIVEVAKVVTIDRTLLGEYIGILSKARVMQILSGMSLVQRSFLRHDSDDPC